MYASFLTVGSLHIFSLFTAVGDVCVFNIVTRAWITHNHSYADLVGRYWQLRAQRLAASWPFL